MKKLLKLAMLVGIVTSTSLLFGDEEQVQVQNSGPYYQSEIQAYVDYGQGGENYYLSITNGYDIDIHADFYSGSTYAYTDDYSTHTGHFVYAENEYDFGSLLVSGLPSGLYTVSSSGPDDTLTVWVF